MINHQAAIQHQQQQQQQPQETQVGFQMQRDMPDKRQSMVTHIGRPFVGARGQHAETIMLHGRNVPKLISNGPSSEPLQQQQQHQQQQQRQPIVTPIFKCTTNGDNSGNQSMVPVVNKQPEMEVTTPLKPFSTITIAGASARARARARARVKARAANRKVTNGISLLVLLCIVVLGHLCTIRPVQGVHKAQSGTSIMYPGNYNNNYNNISDSFSTTTATTTTTTTNNDADESLLRNTVQPAAPPPASSTVASLIGSRLPTTSFVAAASGEFNSSHNHNNHNNNQYQRQDSSAAAPVQQLPNSLADLSSALHMSHHSTSRSPVSPSSPALAHRSSSHHSSATMTTPSLASLYHPLLAGLGAGGLGGHLGGDSGLGGHHHHRDHLGSSANNGACYNGLLTFELTTGFIYTPSSAETLAMLPGTLQLTECLGYCLKNTSCQAVNFEMGLCVLLSSSAQQNPASLLSSQFPVFTIYAEKLCLLPGNSQTNKQRRRCPRAWTFERVAGYEMKGRAKRRLTLPSKEHCMEECLLEAQFECRSANWYRHTRECTLSDQDRHSVTQTGPNDYIIKSSLIEHYGPAGAAQVTGQVPPSGLMYSGAGAIPHKQGRRWLAGNASKGAGAGFVEGDDDSASNRVFVGQHHHQLQQLSQQYQQQQQHQHQYQHQHQQHQQQQFMYQQHGAGGESAALASVDYLENNCIYEPNKLCEFRKLQNRLLKTVDSIYQDVESLDECKQKCIQAPYRCYSFDYGDTAKNVCRTSHLDQSSLTTVEEPYLEMMGAITYELASCYNVSITCKAREMVAKVRTSKMFNGKIYVKSKPKTCVNDIENALEFEINMRYNDRECDVRSTSTASQGVFSNDIVIQHHDRIVTTQDVGLTIHCQYDLSNKSVTNNVNLAIDGLDDTINSMESKNDLTGLAHQSSRPFTVTNLATTVVRSPNITMRITNGHGQPIASATVGDRLALMFEIKEKSSPFGIFVREIVAVDGKGNQQLLDTTTINNNYAHKSEADELYSAAFNNGQGQSVLLIDSLGCPTDSNIMGPLTKLDSIGHTILAPFDAFKFPTSDIVLFKAVVTTCVSECEPVYCGSQPTSSIPPSGHSYSPPVVPFGSTTSPSTISGPMSSTATLYTSTTPFSDTSVVTATSGVGSTSPGTGLDTSTATRASTSLPLGTTITPIGMATNGAQNAVTLATPASANPIRMGPITNNQRLLGIGQPVNELANLDEHTNQVASSLENRNNNNNHHHHFDYSYPTTTTAIATDGSHGEASLPSRYDQVQSFDLRESHSDSLSHGPVLANSLDPQLANIGFTGGVGKYFSLPAAQLYQQQVHGSTVRSYGKKRRRRRRRRRRDLNSAGQTPQAGTGNKDFQLSMNLNDIKFHQLSANIVDVDQIKDILVKRRNGRYYTGTDEAHVKHPKQPIYEMDELVVQSIRIVDKIHFEPGAGNATDRKHKKASIAGSPTKQHSRPLVKQQRRVDDNPTQSSSLGPSQQNESANPTTRVTWVSTGALSLIIGTVSFVFVQIFFVLLCFVSWNKRQVRTISPSSIYSFNLDRNNHNSPQLANFSVNTTSTEESRRQQQQPQHLITTTNNNNHNNYNNEHPVITTGAPQRKSKCSKLMAPNQYQPQQQVPRPASSICSSIWPTMATMEDYDSQAIYVHHNKQFYNNTIGDDDKYIYASYIDDKINRSKPSWS